MSGPWTFNGGRTPGCGGGPECRMKAAEYVRDCTDIRVDQVRGTFQPDKLVARCARGDTLDKYVADAEFEDLIKDCTFEDYQVDAVTSIDRIMPEDLAYVETLDEVPQEYRDDVELKTRHYALLSRLFRSDHWGPFEHPYTTVGMKGITVQSERQITRHRHATFDVQSMRYVDFSDGADLLMPKSVEDPDHALRHGPLDISDEKREQARQLIERTDKNQGEIYRALENLGIPYEDARIVLGIGTRINLTMSGSLRSYLHILNMRSKGDAQWELQGISHLLEEELRPWAPMTMDLWDRHGPVPESP